MYINSILEFLAKDPSISSEWKYWWADLDLIKTGNMIKRRSDLQFHYLVGVWCVLTTQDGGYDKGWKIALLLTFVS